MVVPGAMNLSLKRDSTIITNQSLEILMCEEQSY